MTKHDFSDLTPPHNQVLQWIEKAPSGIQLIQHIADESSRWGAGQAAERLKGQWPEPITDRPPTEADGDEQGYVEYLDERGRWCVRYWSNVVLHNQRWLHTPRWQPPAPPGLTPQQQEAMDALDHILKHSTTNLGEATIRKAIMGGEA